MHTAHCSRVLLRKVRPNKGRTGKMPGCSSEGDAYLACSSAGLVAHLERPAEIFCAPLDEVRAEPAPKRRLNRRSINILPVKSQPCRSSFFVPIDLHIAAEF